MDTIRIGLAGLGHRGFWWLKLMQMIPGFRVTAICDPFTALHEQFLAEIPHRSEVRAYTRYDDLLADPKVDAVALTVRCKEQGALAAQALEAGKHVNSEVPAAHTIDDCWRIVLAAERTGKVYHLAEQTRYWGFVDAWRDLVAEGKLGKVTYGEGQYIGYYVDKIYFWDPDTASYCAVSELPNRPKARPGWLAQMPPIHYLPHELSPMLKIIDDRVVEVTGMGTRPQSYAHPEIPHADIQVALMKTEKDTVLRLAAGFSQPVPHRDHHWYQFIGTKGCVEWKRTYRDLPKMWLADGQMHDMADVDWRYERTTGPAEARGSGHGDADYYTQVAFREAVLRGKAPVFDVYKAMDTAAPAVLAAESIEKGSVCLKVPDFRPGAGRAAGKPPKRK